MKTADQLRTPPQARTMSNFDNVPKTVPAAAAAATKLDDLPNFFKKTVRMEKIAPLSKDIDPFVRWRHVKEREAQYASSMEKLRTLQDHLTKEMEQLHRNYLDIDIEKQNISKSATQGPVTSLIRALDSQMTSKEGKYHLHMAAYHLTNQITQQKPQVATESPRNNPHKRTLAEKVKIPSSDNEDSDIAIEIDFEGADEEMIYEQPPPLPSKRFRKKTKVVFEDSEQVLSDNDVNTLSRKEKAHLKQKEKKAKQLEQKKNRIENACSNQVKTKSKNR